MSRDFTTKPRPDQPGRCPSIDPHDTLQCTRAIHDDDQCQAGGIAWRKGSPRIEWDRERADRLQEEIEEYDATLTRQSDLLTRTVNALRGNPPPLTSWSHHDIPELAAEKVSEIARLTAERDALQVGRDRDRVKGATAVLNEELRTSEQEARARRAEAEVARLTAERDALAAQVARVEALATHWEYLMGESGDGKMLTWRTAAAISALALRAVLADPEADTTDVDVCSGDADCTSALHVHGCFADTAGPCTDPDEHQPTDQEAE